MTSGGLKPVEMMGLCDVGIREVKRVRRELPQIDNVLISGRIPGCTCYEEALPFTVMMDVGWQCN